MIVLCDDSADIDYRDKVTGLNEKLKSWRDKNQNKKSYAPYLAATNSDLFHLYGYHIGALFSSTGRDVIMSVL